MKKQTKLLSLFGKIKCGWAVDDIFIKSEIENNIDNNQAIFTSRIDRNGELLARIWNENIQPKKRAKTLITPKLKNNNNPNIIERNMGSQNDMIKFI